MTSHSVKMSIYHSLNLGLNTDCKPKTDEGFSFGGLCIYTTIFSLTSNICVMTKLSICYIVDCNNRPLKQAGKHIS